jgi:hypothetical protein
MAAAQRSDGSRHWVSGYPELVAQWDRERNGALTPGEVSAGSGQLVWWRCPAGEDHVWRAKPNNRTHGSGCPFCSNRRVSTTNNLARRSPWIAAEWHPEKNGRVSPHDVVVTSSRIAWWRCSQRPEHEWRAGVRDRTRGQTTCPYCQRKRVSRVDSLAESHPALAAEWDVENNGALSPRDVPSGSSRAVWWRCTVEPAHRWRATVVNRVRRASGCPRCSRRRSAVGA